MMAETRKQDLRYNSRIERTFPVILAAFSTKGGLRGGGTFSHPNPLFHQIRLMHPAYAIGSEPVSTVRAE
jgi:hypothetical protein